MTHRLEKRVEVSEVGEVVAGEGVPRDILFPLGEFGALVAITQTAAPEFGIISGLRFADANSKLAKMCSR